MFTGSNLAESELSSPSAAGLAPLSAQETDCGLLIRPPAVPVLSCVDNSGPLRLRMHLLYFERLAHHVRSKMSVPAAVLREQLAGAALELQDFKDGEAALKEILSTLGGLDWGIAADSAAEAAVPVSRMLEGLGTCLSNTCALSGISIAPMNLPAEEDRLLIPPSQFVRIAAALFRYLGSFTTLTEKSLGPVCSTRLVQGQPLAGQLILSCQPPQSDLRQTRLARFAGRSSAIEEVIELDHSSQSLLLFAPLAVLSACGLAARFEPDGTGLNFRIYSIEPAAEGK